MAKLKETLLVVKMSQAIKVDHEEDSSTLEFKELAASLEEIVQQLVGPGVIIEVERL